MNHEREMPPFLIRGMSLRIYPNGDVTRNEESVNLPVLV